MKLNFGKKYYFLVALVVIVAVTVYVFVPKNSATKTEVVNQSTDAPSEEKTGSEYKWSRGPQDPKKIVIPKINVESYIQKVGVDQNKQISVPNNLFVVGWFIDSARPGEKGLSVIDGHVTGRKNDGVFKNLDQLVEGDVYKIEYGNGTIKSFKVMGKKSVPEKESVGVIFSQNPRVKSQVNLVTCSGTFDEKTRSYSERLTITSELIP